MNLSRKYIALLLLMVSSISSGADGFIAEDGKCPPGYEKVLYSKGGFNFSAGANIKVINVNIGYTPDSYTFEICMPLSELEKQGLKRASEAVKSNFLKDDDVELIKTTQLELQNKILKLLPPVPEDPWPQIIANTLRPGIAFQGIWTDNSNNAGNIGLLFTEFEPSYLTGYGYIFDPDMPDARKDFIARINPEKRAKHNIEIATVRSSGCPGRGVTQTQKQYLRKGRPRRFTFKITEDGLLCTSPVTLLMTAHY